MFVSCCGVSTFESVDNKQVMILDQHGERRPDFLTSTLTMTGTQMRFLSC